MNSRVTRAISSKTSSGPVRVRFKTPAKDKRLSAIDAVAKGLAEAKEPMNATAMIEAMAEKGYRTSPIVKWNRGGWA